MKSALLVLLALAGISSAYTLRLSQVMEVAGDDTECMTQTYDGKEEVLFVKKAVIVGDKDVAQAIPDSRRNDAINITLNEAGAKEFEAVTGKMQAGIDRIAIIVDGRVMSAPVVQQVPLGAQFQVSGFKDLDAGGLDDLARKISGRPPRPAEEEPPVAQPIPRPKTVPYTEAEYRQIKAEREKMGAFFLDSMPSEEELNKTLHKGMTYGEVIKIYGRPYGGPKPPAEPDGDIEYRIAPEKRPDNPEGKMLPEVFSVHFEEQKVVSWLHTVHSPATREEKVLGREQPTLKMRLPKMDLSSDDFDLVKLVEGIVIPNPEQKINERDLGELAQIGSMLTNEMISDKSKDESLNANCDFIKTTAHHFPEIATLKEQAKDGRIPVNALGEAFKPYIMGRKPFPPVTPPDTPKE